MTAESLVEGTGSSPAIIRKAVDFIKAQTGAEARLIAVGRKANQFFTRRHYSMAFNHSVPSAGARLEDAIEVSRVARQMFESGEVDAIYVCYSKFYSAIRQVPQVVPLLPIVAPEGAEAGVSGEYKFEPSPEALLNVLKEQLSGVKVYVLGDEPEKPVYIVGKTKAGQWAGLKTSTVET